jgi:hypothetical protein
MHTQRARVRDRLREHQIYELLENCSRTRTLRTQALRCKQRPSARPSYGGRLHRAREPISTLRAISLAFNRAMCSAISWRTALSVLNCRGCWLLAGQRKLESCTVSALTLTQRPSLQRLRLLRVVVKSALGGSAGVSNAQYPVVVIRPGAPRPALLC